MGNGNRQGADHSGKTVQPPPSLCRRAEELLEPDAPEGEQLHSKDAAQRLLQELQVHQIELEMQNAELQRARYEVEVTLERYADLYDFAPVGYFTLGRDGAIGSVNLTGATYLGCERSRLIGRRFGKYVADEVRPRFSDYLGKVFAGEGNCSCEVELVREGSSPLFVQIEAVAFGSGEECRAAVLDITGRRQAEGALLRVHDDLELRVAERTGELSRAVEQLTHEISERSRAEGSLLDAYAEITELKDRLQAENIYLRQEDAQQYNFGDIIGGGSAISSVFLKIKQVAPMNATVLLTGETGVGKGVVARAIHSRSTRKERPMITVNCASLPGSLIESELFGRERGAFTGANERQIGRFELADGGTIFLDEIGEMPLDLQCKLLRVIQDGEFERLGGPRTIKVNVRIIAASNRNLEDEIRNGRFREDLFYRLNVFPILVPPLRQRQEDIPLLVSYFVAKFNKKMGKEIETVSKDTLDNFSRYSWPGNVRELESIVERGVITSSGKALEIFDWRDRSRSRPGAEGEAIKELAELEQHHILRVLQKTGWRVEGKEGAAVILGLNPSTLRARMRKYCICRA